MNSSKQPATAPPRIKGPAEREAAAGAMPTTGPRRTHPAHLNADAVEHLTEVKTAAMSMALMTGRAAVDLERVLAEKLVKAAGEDFQDALQQAKLDTLHEIRAGAR